MSKNRAAEIAGFLTEHGWGDAETFPFVADFSPRRYARLVGDDNKRAILMDADENQHTPEFVMLADVLRSIGLSAPEIYAADVDAGLVLLEDFGGRNIGALIDQGSEAKPFMHRALDVLIHMHGVVSADAARRLDLPLFGGALFAAQVELFVDEYFPVAAGREATHAEWESFRDAWKQVLRGIEGLPQNLLLRDFMPDNLMDLPARQGVQNIGLLDFQDAGVGPIAYDIASLCEVVRRNAVFNFDDAIAYYHQQAKPEVSIEKLTVACRILLAQRHMRILGIVAKQVKAGRREKQELIPRIRAYLGELLQDEALAPVREWMRII